MENYLTPPLDQTFAALSDPTRRAMLMRLEQARELTVSDLAQPLSIQLPTVLKHLGVLTDAGLVLREKQGRTVKVRLAAGAMKAAVDWLNRHERFWSQSLERLVEAAEAKEAESQAAAEPKDDA